MRRFGQGIAIMLITLALSLLASPALAASVVKTNSEGGEVDGGRITRSATIAATDVVAGATVDIVTIAVDFEKISDAGQGNTCPSVGGPGHDGLGPINDEIAVWLTSPSGTRVVLIEDFVNSGGSGGGTTYTNFAHYGGRVTVTFNDSAVDQVGGFPTTGTFQPVQPLVGFSGEDPVGDWVLTISDSGSNDPLCFYNFDLTVTTDDHLPTNTPTSTPTNTPVPPTNTPTNTATPTNTSTPTITPTPKPGCVPSHNQPNKCTPTPTRAPTSTPKPTKTSRH